MNIDKNKVYWLLNWVAEYGSEHLPDGIPQDKYLNNKYFIDYNVNFLRLYNKLSLPEKKYFLNTFNNNCKKLGIIDNVVSNPKSGFIGLHAADYSKALQHNKEFINSGGNLITADKALKRAEEYFNKEDFYEFRDKLSKKGYEIDRDDNGKILITNPEKEAEKYAQINKYKDLTARQEDELTKQYAAQANQTDWVKIAIYVIIAIIVAYIIYRIVKWLYRWYKKRKTAKQLQNESVSYNFFNYRLCEADETHQIGKLYNSMMSPIINFFKRVFSGSLSVLSYISNMISNFSKKVYQLFTNTFRQKKPMDKLKQEYSTISNKINNLCKSPILRSKLDNIQTVLPKV